MNAAAGLAVGCAAAAVVVLLQSGGRSDPVTRTFPDKGRSGPPLLADAFDRWERWIGPEQLKRHLWVLGRRHATNRRLQCAAAAVGALIALVMGAASGPRWFVPVLAAGGGIAGLLAQQRWVARSAQQRLADMSEQMTEVTELVALGVTAGRAPADAFALAAEASPEPIRTVLQEVADGVAQGQRLSVALARAGDQLRLGDFDRLATTLVTASDRGVPLAATLSAQVSDVRAVRRAELLRQAGRRETAMLVPIVLLVLPCVVAVSLLPGVMTLWGL